MAPDENSLRVLCEHVQVDSCVYKTRYEVMLAPVLQEDIPYVVVSHSMGTWMCYEFLKLVGARAFSLSHTHSTNSIQTLRTGILTSKIPMEWLMMKPRFQTFLQRE